MLVYYRNKNTATLHYNSLGTHNNFFQIMGRKLFILIPFEQIEYCYIAEKNSISIVNFKKFTQYKKNLEGEDLLYLSLYTLHYVKGLALNISANIEWHTLESVKNTFSSGYIKRLRQNLWNTLSLLGLYCKIPTSLIIPLYRSQFNCL